MERDVLIYEERFPLDERRSFHGMQLPQQEHQSGAHRPWGRQVKHRGQCGRFRTDA